jgi:hypothetical protein
MDTIIELFQKCDMANIIVMIAMFYWFNGRLEKNFDKIDDRFDRIESDIKELRTSVNRMEGALMSKDCCMLKDDKQSKKVE